MRFFLLPFLLFSFVFACDLPHEEVGGYKIGCTYEGNGELKESVKNDEGIQVFEEKLTDGFFETAEIAVLKGNIEKITFNVFYGDSNLFIKKTDDFLKDRDSLIASVSERWGDYETVDLGEGTMMYSINYPKSEIVNNILIAQMPSYAYGFVGLSITYSSKKITDYEEELSVQEKGKRSKQLEGF